MLFKATDTVLEEFDLFLDENGVVDVINVAGLGSRVEQLQQLGQLVIFKLVELSGDILWGHVY